MQRITISLLVAIVGTVGGATSSLAACNEKARFQAAGAYAECELREVGKFVLGSGDKFYKNVSRCRVRYTSEWERKLAATCGPTRFLVGGGTVADRLTALQWEQKTDDGSVHDKDNVYAWSLGDGLGTDADGPAFSAFLATLNSAPCFAAHCDWRLPTRAELNTILAEPYPCTTIPCVDELVFGPTLPEIYWTATTSSTSPFYAWGVDFGTGVVGSGSNKSFLPHAVRAVRGGL